MKRRITFLFFIIFISGVYAHDFILTSLKTEKNTVSVYRGKSVQTVSDDNFLVSMLAIKNDHGIQFSTSISNFSINDYYFDENCIEVYQGNFDVGDWNKIEYIPATIYYERERKAAKTNEILSAVALGLSAASAGYSTVNGSVYSNGYRYTYTARVYSPSDAAIATANSYIALDNLEQRNQDYLAFLENNLLYSSEIPATENYNGIFVVKAKKGPDYKVVMAFSPEKKFEFYFTRSDKDEILHPWKDKSHSRHSVVAGISPTFKRFSAYYLWSQPKGVGAYTGISFQKESIGIKSFGKLSVSNFSEPSAYELGYPNPLNVSYESFYDWKFDYNNSSYKYDSFGMYGGITIKTFPNTWLLAGIGTDMIA